jgi:hypothetical protein
MNPEVTLETPVITLDIHVPDIEQTLSLYNRIEIWRSADDTVYEEITSPEDTRAVINGTQSGPWNLNGLTLSISKNATQAVNITFTATDPYDLQTLLNIINPYFYDPNNQTYKIATQIPAENKVRFTSDLDGLESSLELTGTALSVLGLTTNKVYGKLHRIVLTNPTIRYRFYDTSAEGQLFYYKTRFSNTKTGRLSSFSESILGKLLPVLSPSQLVTCWAKFSDNQGNPIKNKRVVLVIQQPQAVGNSPTITNPLIGILEERIELRTDQYGFCSTSLPKNTNIKIYIENSYVNRVINTGIVDFDLLDKLSITQDPFNLEVTIPQIPVVSLNP